MNIEKNIYKLRWIAAIRWTFITIPIIILFFQKYGLTYTEIFIIQAIYALAIVIFQIPTGYIADMFGRKKVLIFGCLLLICGTGLYAFVHNLTSFICAEVLIALSNSLCMGADSALLYETLEKMQQTDTYNQQEGTIQFYGRISEAFGGILGGILAYAISFEASFIAWFFSSLLSLPFALTLIDTKKKEICSQNVKIFTLKKTITDIKEASVNIFKIKKIIGFILFYSAILGFATLSSTWLFQPILNNSGLPVYMFGIVWAILNLSAAFFAQYAATIQRLIGLKKVIILIPIILAITIFLLGKTSFLLLTLLFIILIQGMRGLKSPIILNIINHQIDDKMRATILSYEEMFTRLLFGICAPFVGFFSTRSLPETLQHLAIVTLVFGVLLGSIVLRNSRQLEE